MRGYRDLGYTVVQDEDRRRAAGRGPRRIEAVIAVVGMRRATWRSMPTAASISPTALAYAEALAPYDLFWYEEAGDPLDYELQAELGRALRAAAGHRREPLLDARTRAT